MNSFVLNPSLWPGALALATGAGFAGALAARAATMAFGARDGALVGAGAAFGAGGVLAVTAFPGVVFATGMDSLEAGVEGVVVAASAFGGVAATAGAGATDVAGADATTEFSNADVVAPSGAVLLRFVSPLRILSVDVGLLTALTSAALAEVFTAFDSTAAPLGLAARATVLSSVFRALVFTALVLAALALAALARVFVAPVLLDFPELALAAPALAAALVLLATLDLAAALARVAVPLPRLDFVVFRAVALPEAAFVEADFLFVVWAVVSEAVRAAVDFAFFVRLSPVAPLLPLEAALRLFVVFLLEGIRGVLLCLSRFGDGTGSLVAEGKLAPRPGRRH